MPVYNAKDFVLQSIRSAVNQIREVDFELIVVDDASTDGTSEVVKKYASTGEARGKIRLVPLSRNVGTCQARNVGCQGVTGDYLAFLDQDDQWINGKLQMLLDYLRGNRDCGMVFGNLEAADSSGCRMGFLSNKSIKHRISWEDVLLLHSIYPSGSMLRKEIFDRIGGYNPEFVLSGAYGDQELHLRVVERSTIDFVDELVGLYRWEVERTSRLESFLRNLPIYARICWEARRATPLQDHTLQRRFVNVCQGQYVYYADLLLSQYHKNLSNRQLNLIADPPSLLAKIFGETYLSVTGMRLVKFPDTVSSPSMRLLLAIFLLRPDLQQKYPEAIDGEYSRLLGWARSVSRLETPDRYQRLLLTFRTEWPREQKASMQARTASSHAEEIERWLHTPNWDFVRCLVGEATHITENPDDPRVESVSDLPFFPNVEDLPEVSIIVPSHNKIGYLLNCLKSIAANTKRFDGQYEVLVVDNGSDDRTRKILSGIAGLRSVTLESNRGFVEACNVGASATKGGLMVFLNNDTMVTPLWLDRIVSTINDNQTIAAVGVKLVYPSGRLQEAGGIIWSDGKGHNYGRGDNLEKADYSYVREVDYCSGSCLAVRRDVFNDVGGFDVRYSPGYFEDADLCFSIREKGYKVIYQPTSVVIHFEGVTGGRDLRFGAKRFQAINHEKFVEKWKVQLRGQSKSGDIFRGRSRGAGYRVLIVERCVPEPDKNSGDNRLRYLVGMLKSNGWEVTIFADDNKSREPYTTLHRNSGVEIVYEGRLDQLLKERANLYDIVWLARPHIGFKYIDLVRNLSSGSKIIFDLIDLYSLREKRWAELAGDESLIKLSEDSKMQELYVAQRSDLTIAISEREKALMIQEDSIPRIKVIPNVHEVDLTDKCFKNRRDLLFLGGFEHAPNVDSLCYFLDEIFDRIRSRLPEVNLVVIGSDMPEKIRSLKHDDVRILGYVKDLRPYFDSSKAFVAPIRFGAGTKGKIGLSMAHGLPVVTTSIGAEGMGLEHGENVLISDSPSQFADYVIDLYTDEDVWRRLSRNGKEHIALRNDPTVVESRLLSMLTELINSGDRRLSGSSDPNQLRAELDVLEEELTQTRMALSEVTNELMDIRGSFMVRIMKFFAVRIDTIAPPSGRIRQLSRIVFMSLMVIHREGLRSYWRKALEKIGRREFFIRSV